VVGSGSADSPPERFRFLRVPIGALGPQDLPDSSTQGERSITMFANSTLAAVRAASA
jgi:hypothetical protein